MNMAALTAEISMAGRRYLVTFEGVLVAVAVHAIGIDRRGTGSRRGIVGGTRRLRLDGPKAQAAIKATGKLQPTTKEIKQC